MTEDTDQNRLVTFENNLWVGGLGQKAEMEVKPHLPLLWGHKGPGSPTKAYPGLFGPWESVNLDF